MGYNEDFIEFAKKQHKCKGCEFYASENKNLKIEDIYRGKVAICTQEHSGRYKVGHNSICCEFYDSKFEEIK